MIQSMTRQERDDPNVLVREPSRVQRIAKGSAQPAEGVSELVQRFLFMAPDDGRHGRRRRRRLLGKIPGMGGLNMARNMRRAMKSGKMQDMMANMGGMGGIPRNGRNAGHARHGAFLAWAACRAWAAPPRRRCACCPRARKTKEEPAQARARRAQEGQKVMSGLRRSCLLAMSLCLLNACGRLHRSSLTTARRRASGSRASSWRRRPQTSAATSTRTSTAK